MELRKKVPTFIVRLFLTECALLVLAQGAYASHPLITDDAGTQGKGKTQLEFNGEYEREKGDGARSESFTGPTIPVLSYGISDNTDIALGASYQHVQTRDAEGTRTVNGMTDTGIDLKWRFFEREGLAFALKPGITLPTGNDKRGLGAGRVTYHLDFIATKEIKPWDFHFNLGYTRNENGVHERENLWKVSLAGVLDVARNLKAIGNVGIERNTDRASHRDPAFVLGGLIYSIRESLDIDIGVRMGINRRGTDYSVPAGITWKF